MKPLIFALFTLLSISFVSGDLHLRRSEDSEVTICGRNDICSLVHNPKWGANSVEKLCECPEKPFCPTTYSTTDGLSISVNAWTQMKFCSPILDIQSKLEMCDEGEVAIKVKTIYHIDQVKNVSASMECNCNHDDGPTYWRYHSRLGRTLEDEKFFEVVDNFQCSGEFKDFKLSRVKHHRNFQNFINATQMSFVDSHDSTSVSSINDVHATPFTTADFSPKSRRWKRK